MKPLTASEIRASFVNATRGEIDRVPMPGLHEVVFYCCLMVYLFKVFKTIIKIHK